MGFFNNINNFFKRSNNQNNAILDPSSDRNENARIFARVNDDIQKIIAAKSIVSQDIEDQNRYVNPVFQNIQIDGENYATPIATNKVARINQYRTIARYPECNWALTEIADDFIHDDINGKLIILDPIKKLNETRNTIIQNEFEKFMNLFRLRDNGFNLIRKFLVEGELCWENIIDHERPELGIRGIRFINAEYYETLVDLKTKIPVGILIDTKRMNEDLALLIQNSCTQNAQYFNNILPVQGGSFTFDIKSSLPLLWPQITYINTGDIGFDDVTVYPVLERARQAYQQLALLQDAAIILRVTRAPQRLLFNIDTGRMSPNLAEEKVREFAASLKSRKVPSKDGEDITGVYNPVSMLENYVFQKAAESGGTTMEAVGNNADYDQISDIDFFMRRFLKTFNIPWSRYKTPENTMERNDTINYEEYSFSRMLVRYQRQFAIGYKKSFITHLKLRGIWNKYELKDSDINVNLVKPVLYDLYQTGKEMEQRMNIYKLAVEDDNMSKSLAMKKYLKMSDEEVTQNYIAGIKDAEMMKLKEYFADKIGGNGAGLNSEFNKSPIPIHNIDDKPEIAAQAKQEAEGGGEGGGDAGAEGGGDDAGAEAPETGSEEPAEQPEQNEAPPAPSFGLG